MSVAEMKLAAIAEISKLSDEKTVKEILQHLEKLNSGAVINTPATDHAASIINERSSVLEKLAK